MNFASYQLWSQFEPALGWEDTHCQMQRGWRWTQPATPTELQTSPVIETIWQKVGKLAQQGVYEFHQDPLLLKHPRGVDRVADRLYLYYEVAPVRQRVMRILQQYQAEPWLVDRDILVLNRGDESIPDPIEIQIAEDRFQLFAAFDCLVREPDGQIHMIDFKTGQADFDRRQAYVYLLAISYLYPDQDAVASFYNLETNTRSALIIATSAELAQVAAKLAEIARLHQQQLQAYRDQPDYFDRLFPPHPGNHCRYCPFNYLCTYAAST
ncbi:MAG: hypothetical protein RLZZ135_2089 [Cyanobacteriota bacterium]